MIYITKGTNNKVVLTLSESSNYTNPYYVFVFRNEYNIDSDPIISIFTDISSYKGRYNLFVIPEDDLYSTVGGAIDDGLSLISGQYSYSIYESEGEPITPVDISLIDYLNLVETGRMVVSGCEDNIEEIDDNIYS